MNRRTLAFILSFLALAISIWVWLDLFVFAKVSYMPAWQSHLPPWLRDTTLMVLISLIPAAFLTKTVKDAFLVLTTVILFSPLPALLMAMISEALTANITNILLSYIWIVGVHCLGSALFLFLARVVYEWLLSKLKA
jgi:hypothetical protein